ncbi:hypothetical protein DFH09DRAFT_1038072 [Mycena vulgaris]|nr:hypothetical protein DFH09DRAFT_1038072 [Mycena vulgaris]
MTFVVLRALHAILGDALADIERVYALEDTTTTTPSSLSGTTTTNHRKAPSLSSSYAYASPPLSPSSASSPPLDFPSLDAPCDPASPSEQLTAHPTVVAAINCIVAAVGQMTATVQVPFLSLCDTSMGYHLPSCLRLLEAAHVPELLRAGPLHVREIAARMGVEQAKLAHILRLLATHHLLREAAPDVFAVNHISSLIDTGKPIHEVLANPERKYDETSGVAAFVGLWWVSFSVVFISLFCFLRMLAEAVHVRPGVWASSGAHISCFWAHIPSFGRSRSRIVPPAYLVQRQVHAVRIY